MYFRSFRTLLPPLLSASLGLLLAGHASVLSAANLTVTNTTLPMGVVGAAYSAQLGASGGQTPYSWSLAPGSASLPNSLFLNANGLISGTPTTSQTNSFKVQVVDADSAVTNKVLSIAVLKRPTITNPKITNGLGQITLTNVCGQPITIQYSTDLIRWFNLLTTNLPCGIVTVIFPLPPNAFIRVVIECAPVSVSPGALNFTGLVDGPTIASQSITITNFSINCALTYTLTTNAPWLSLSTSTLSLDPGASASISVSVSDAGLSPGATYQGAIVVSDSDTNNPGNAQSIPVTLAVRYCAPVTVIPTALNFTDPADGTAVAGKSFTISNDITNCSLDYVITTNVSWLSLSSTSGSVDPGGSALITVTVSDAALYAGVTYQGVIVVSDADLNHPGNSQSIPVTLAIANAQMTNIYLTGGVEASSACDSADPEIIPSNAPPSDSFSAAIGGCLQSSGDGFLSYSYNNNTFAATGSADSSGPTLAPETGNSQIEFGFGVSHLTRFEAYGSATYGGMASAAYSATNGVLSPGSGSLFSGYTNAGGGGGSASFDLNVQLLSGPGP